MQHSQIFYNVRQCPKAVMQPNGSS